jgi:hypothetical protein
VQRFQGTVGTPELETKPGMSVKLTHRRVQIADTAGFRALDLAQLDGLVLALDWVNDKGHHVWGSAVMVAPGVALTATHVVEHMRAKGFLQPGGGYLLAYGFHTHGMTIWNPDCFYPIGAGDLSVITLVRATAKPSLPADVPIPVNAATIAARVPSVGETVTLFGFQATADEFKFEPGGTNLTVGHYAGVGEVTDCFPQGRGRVFPAPHAIARAKTVGGMSGGAAFDASGRLVGVVTSGEEETSSFSFVWPCIYSPLVIGWPANLTPEPATLHELATRGHCVIDGIENVHSHIADDGTPLVSLLTEAP